METGFEQHTDGELLAVIDAALNALNDDRLRLPTDTEQLSLLLTSLRVGGRLQAWQQRLAARIDTDEVAWREHRTSTTTWLAEAGNLTPREARRLVRSGQDLRRFATVAAAATDGTILPGQAEAISGVLTALPPDFPAASAATCSKHWHPTPPRNSTHSGSNASTGLRSAVVISTSTRTGRAPS
jgi:hypothetical protein